MVSRIRRLLVPPIFADEEKTRISQFIITFSWVAICVVLLLILSRVVFSIEEIEISLAAFGAIILILLLMQQIVRMGYVYEASTFLVFSLWGMLTYLAWRADGVRGLAVVSYIIVIILANLLLGWRYSLLTGVMSVSVIWYLGIVEKQGLRAFNADDPIIYTRDLTAIFILIGVLIYLLNADWSLTLRSARVELQERLRAEEKLQRQADYLSALNETALGLLNRSEISPLLETILKRACDLLDTEHGLIEMALPDQSALRQDVGLGVLAKYNGTLTLKNEGVTGNVWASGKTLAVQDYRTWSMSLPDFVNAGFNAVLGVPLKVGNEVIGVLAISLVEKDRIFNQEQINLMERFAALASIAIDNAQLYEQTQKELTERAAAETALRSSEERFRKVFHASPVAIVTTSLSEGRIIEANDSYWKLAGLDPEKSLNKTSVELGIWVSEEDRNKFTEKLKQEHSIYDPEYKFVTQSGETRPTLAFYELVKLGKEDCVLSMFYDVTEQEEARESLQSSEARMRAVLASIPDTIFEISREGIFLDFMASTEITSVMPPSQFIGRSVREIFPPIVADQTFFALERALDTDQLHAFEYETAFGEEIQFFEARISAITSDSAIIMVRDITQEKFVRTHREDLISELEDKNSELERFTYTVSHDLKSPLITIKGFLGFLEQSALSGNTLRLKADIKRIAEATDKMQMLLNDLLELSRVGRLAEPHQNVDIGTLTREVVELLYGRLHEKEIIVEIKEDLPMAHADRRRLFEVMQNLIDNAAKFMGNQPKPHIEIGHAGSDSEMPVFYVKDNGMGIEQMHLERIFGLFNKLDAQSDGTGIGLALVKRIIEFHKGKIWAQSELGQGTTFFFTLPPAK